MSSTVIPKEQLSAYQRWEMASFGDERASTKQDNVLAAQQAAEQLALQREEARRQGHDEGYADGFAQGQAAGMEAARAEIVRELLPLQQIANSFGAELAHATDNVAVDMLNLALDLAKAMLKTSLKIKPELVLPVVSEAIRYLPTVQQPALLALHPQDAAIVREYMGDDLQRTGWRITEDTQMERGGCRVETASNQIDATQEVRWQRIADALGKQNDWLE
ncbi:flagellar assembly protein FliH [Noviherbaspirillum saxi]|uniref:Flagellar assembly protein FliH n=1 Tax=Noviherbaspirillum saxi TaxID=2320863 RepID=A0A3A3G932_9BURK|nr:flagellar assembly protein FliH [Noviherbaspirillum saxi]RJF98655.1 flagellar assembly protein FliH [Noviherbaspirillum saxi]